MISEQAVYNRLKEVMDPELHVDIVSLGLVYDVTVRDVQHKDGVRPFIHVLLTLTTPGCPLAGMFDTMIKDSLVGLAGIEDVGQQVETELTFDPPWVPDMMSEEARAHVDLMF